MVGAGRERCVAHIDWATAALIILQEALIRFAEVIKILDDDTIAVEKQSRSGPRIVLCNQATSLGQGAAAS